MDSLFCTWNRKHGKGVKVWANGDRYEGEWREDKQHGRGIYMWANGDRYEGEWKDGDLHGEGIKVTACTDFLKRLLY